MADLRLFWQQRRDDLHVVVRMRFGEFIERRGTVRLPVGGKVVEKGVAQFVARTLRAACRIAALAGLKFP
jgi:hypothetical protein